MAGELRHRIVVVGLGPAGPELVTPQARAAIDSVKRRFLRTSRHPSAGVVEGATSFDYLYESVPDFETLYRGIVDALGRAAESGTVLYAVPGSPAVAERTVELLVSDRRLQVDLVPGLSFVDLAWSRLGIDPVAASVRLLDGTAFGTEAAGLTGPFLVSQCWSREVLSGIKLAIGELGAEAPVTVLQRLGLPGEKVCSVPWQELDRVVEPDHLTSVFVGRLASPVSGEIARLEVLVGELRERCPWDRRQTHRSLLRHLVEETYETVDAIEALDGSPAAYADLEEELGDLLFQVCFHSRLASEEGQFALADVARTVHDKLVARHPHVFGDTEATTAEAVMANWERLKLAEKGRRSMMEGIPTSLPSLLTAQKVLRKVATTGIEPVEPLGGAGRRQIGTEELGSILLSAAELARAANLDAESALRFSTARIRRRFERAEELAAGRGWDVSGLDPSAAAALWEEAGEPPPVAGSP